MSYAARPPFDVVACRSQTRACFVLGGSREASMRFVTAGLVMTVIGVAAWISFVRPLPRASAQAQPAAHGAATHGAATHPAGMAPDEAMRQLREGNARFVQQTATNAHHDAARREE